MKPLRKFELRWISTTAAMQLAALALLALLGLLIDPDRAPTPSPAAHVLTHTGEGEATEQPPTF